MPPEKNKDGPRKPIRFNNKAAQGGMAGLASIFGIIGASMIADSSPDWVWGLGYVLASVALGYRGLISSSVVIDEVEVTTRSMISTHRYPLAEIASVEVSVGQTGMNGRGREYLTLNLVDGRSVAFQELNSAPGKDGEPPSDVRVAAEVIEARIGGSTGLRGK